MNLNKKYLLAIKRDNNDYLPLEWNCLSTFSGENLNSLEGIDSFTTKQPMPIFIQYIINEKLADENEKFQKFVILHIENNNKRELKAIFEEEKDILDFNQIIEFLRNNIENKNIINQIYTMCSSKKASLQMQQYAYILKNISNFISRGENAVYAALLQFDSLPYEEKRKLSILIREKFMIEQTFSNRLIKKEIA